MKIKYLLLVIATVAITHHASAQYSADAIRFSGTQPGSTSRIKALGNANVSVGGDLTSIGGNPAGLGFFTKSELSITPELNMNKTNSYYLGQNTNGSRNDGNFNNASVVFYGKLNKAPGEDKSKGWLSVNFGASYNRTNNFYQKTSYRGENLSSSIADYYADLGNIALANNYSLNGYLEGWAQNQGLIKLNSDKFYDPTTALGGTQYNTINTTGGQSSLDFSFGANYSNKFYIGGGFGITNIRYNTTSDFTEERFLTENINRNYVSTYTRDQSTRGNGFNGRLGIIYKPVEMVRVGATVTTPTWYTIDDSSSEGLATKYGNERTQSDGSNYPLTYQLRTPYKVAGGISVFAGKLGFITGDIEYVDYASTKLSESSDYEFDFSGDNADIKSFYKGAVNARFGAEARLTPNFMLRGGYGILGSPVRNADSDANTKTISGGVGYRFANYYIDATYMHIQAKYGQYPYEIGELSPLASIKNTNNNVFVTLGLRF